MIISLRSIGKYFCNSIVHCHCCCLAAPINSIEHSISLPQYKYQQDDIYCRRSISIVFCREYWDMDAANQICTSNVSSALPRKSIEAVIKFNIRSVSALLFLFASFFLVTWRLVTLDFMSVRSQLSQKLVLEFISMLLVSLVNCVRWDEIETRVDFSREYLNSRRLVLPSPETYALFQITGEECENSTQNILHTYIEEIFLLARHVFPSESWTEKSFTSNSHSSIQRVLETFVYIFAPFCLSTTIKYFIIKLSSLRFNSKKKHTHISFSDKIFMRHYYKSTGCDSHL